MNDHAGHSRGIRACVWMLKSMTHLSDHALEPGFRDHGQSQDNAVLRAIRPVINRGDAHELEGFCAALTELAMVANESGDFERIFADHANRQERIKTRWAKRKTESAASNMNPLETVKREMGVGKEFQNEV